MGPGAALAAVAAGAYEGVLLRCKASWTNHHQAGDLTAKTKPDRIRTVHRNQSKTTELKGSVAHPGSRIRMTCQIYVDFA